MFPGPDNIFFPVSVAMAQYNTILMTGVKIFNTKVDVLQSQLLAHYCTILISLKTGPPCKVETLCAININLQTAGKLAKLQTTTPKTS
jgi:hypothetical protein